MVGGGSTNCFAEDALLFCDWSQNMDKFIYFMLFGFSFLMIFFTIFCAFCWKNNEFIDVFVAFNLFGYCLLLFTSVTVPIWRLEIGCAELYSSTGSKHIFALLAVPKGSLSRISFFISSWLVLIIWFRSILSIVLTENFLILCAVLFCEWFCDMLFSTGADCVGSLLQGCIDKCVCVGRMGNWKRKYGEVRFYGWY